MHQNGVKLSILVGAVAAAVLTGAYVYSLWASELKKRENQPVEASGAMVRDLRRFHARSGSFPRTLRELEGTVWQRKPREFTDNGLGLYSRNYFYLYGRVSDHEVTIWAVPIGPRRKDSPVLFVSASPDRERRWMGPLSESADKLESISKGPSKTTLSTLGLTEQTTPPR